MEDLRTLNTGARYRRRRWTLAGITIIVIGLAAFAIGQAAQQAATAQTVQRPSGTLVASQPSDVPQAATQGSDGGRIGTAPSQDGEVTAADGLIREGEPVDAWSEVPAVTNLDAQLRDALRRASADAAAAGIDVRINSAWRSDAYQDQLLRDATAKYGSKKEAARWVATAEESAHVSGDAVDLGSSRALDWLSRHGAGYGLCQIYANEAWHYELRPDAVDRGCPEMFADPAQKREEG